MDGEAKLSSEEGLLDGGDSEEELLVMSEVHLGCPPGFSGPHISHFAFSVPSGRFGASSQEERALTSQMISFDEDGDLVLPRRNGGEEQPGHCYNVKIQHSITSPIPSVGLQVWRAELVLADFVLHRMLSSSEFNGIVALELGAGTGLVGLLLASVVKTVYLTDRGDEILDNCAKNVHLNSGLFRSQAGVRIRELDWMKPWPPIVCPEEAPPNRKYSWSSTEVEEVQGASLLLAADVIYSDELTDAFFSILERLMSHGSKKVFYMALEKRYNFTLDDLDVVANGYLHFRSYLREEDDDAEHEEDIKNRHVPCFSGKRIDISKIPQYVSDYKRGEDVEIWEIKYDTRKNTFNRLE